MTAEEEILATTAGTETRRSRSSWMMALSLPNSAELDLEDFEPHVHRGESSTVITMLITDADAESAVARAVALVRSVTGWTPSPRSIVGLADLDRL
jgi:hypothetical protein